MTTMTKTQVPNSKIQEFINTNTYRAVLISTGHLSEEDEAAFKKVGMLCPSSTEILKNRCFKRDSGYLVKLMKAFDESDVSQEVSTFRDAGFSEQFCQIITFCITADIQLIEFDCDGNDFEELFELYE